MKLMKLNLELKNKEIQLNLIQKYKQLRNQ